MLKTAKRKTLLLLSLLTFTTPHLFLLEVKEIKTKEIKINIDFTGITHAYDEYDIRAEFDGSIAFIYSSSFDIVRTSDTLMRLVTGEVAALLKTAKDENEKKDILNRWKKMFRYSDIKAPSDGIITKIHVSEDSYVKKGDLLLTMARKMRVIAKNTKPLYMTPIQGLEGVVETQRGIKYRVILKDFIKEKEEEGKWRFFFDFEQLPNLKIGEVVKGILVVASKTSTRVIPNSDIFEYNNKKYILIEFEPGIISEDETEITSFKLNYLKITKDISNYVK